MIYLSVCYIDSEFTNRNLMMARKANEQQIREDHFVNPGWIQPIGQYEKWLHVIHYNKKANKEFQKFKKT